MDWKLKMERSKLFEWVKETYGTELNYLWNDWNKILRHAESKKWYAVILKVPVQKLGLTGKQIINILNSKRDSLLPGFLCTFREGKMFKAASMLNCHNNFQSAPGL